MVGGAFSGKKKIFKGVRVLDFSRVLAGPYCTRMLADMGAEVIKVEQPVTGDDARGFPYVISPGNTGYYLQQNCGKKSISLDMRKKEAIAILKKLVAVSDVVVENFRPGIMAKYTLDYESLRAVKNDIIMCSISAYGQTGPLSSFVGNDLTTQAMSGLMDMTGEPDGPPTNVGAAIGDTIAGAHAFGAISSALYHRERTGCGEYIDISMLDCMFAQFEIAVQTYVLTKGEKNPRRAGIHHPTVVPLGTYRAADGWVVIGVFNDSAWKRLAEIMGKTELIEDNRFAGNAARAANRETVIGIVQEWVKNISVKKAVVLLQEARILTAPVLSVSDVINHPQIKAREMLAGVEHEGVGTVKITNSPLKLRNTEAGVSGKAPLLGENNRDVLTGIGFSSTEIDLLKKNGVIYDKL
ncbi:MAG: Formyl-coenzyme A transferase [Smithella sp. PtaU1.Bin162]|nr:MAG: Formyl-coenzyme A transferase [Smithella sp. PtaU1.Bin162]